MIRQPPPPQTPVAFVPIWPGLPSDLQQRAVRLLAQLAYAQFCQPASPAIQETYHGNFTQQPQGSARPS
jgi:hypothetical protein